MSEARIRKLETKYRLPGSLLAEHRRLEQLGAPVMEAAFAQAIDRLNLPEETEICIRDLYARVCLRLSSTDRSLIAHWSTTLANEILAAVQNASTRRAVVYQSRRQALVDLAVSIGRGDLRRCWAWRQLGLWRPGPTDSEAESIVELVHSLCSEPVLIVPTLSALASSGCLAQIASRLTEEHWESLAAAALSEGEATYLLTQRGEAPTPKTVREAWYVINTSAFLRSVVSLPWIAQMSTSVRRSIAALAVLNVDPVLLRGKSATALIDVIADATTASEQTNTADQNALSANGRVATSAPTPPTHILAEQALLLANETGTSNSPTNNLAEQALISANETGPSTSPAHNLAEQALLSANETGTSGPPTHREADQSQQSKETDTEATITEIINGQENREPLRAQSRRNAKVLAETQEDAPPLDLRQRAFTRWGGLLFLFGVLEKLSLPEVLLDHPVLGERRFIWVLHQLALTLAPIPADDPAALAFAGLPPRAMPPSATEAPPTEIETEALIQLATTITDRLSSLLDFSTEKLTGVLEFVCCRRAEIVADPGWIEARLSLDEVSTEIRRAGLDLDPGYVRWLGVVLRFVYE